MNSYANIRTAEEEGVGILQLDRLEKRNALDWALHHEMLAALEGWSEDDTVSCVLLIGNEEVFCAGWDLSVLDGIQGDDQRRFTELATKLMTELYDYRKPTVAAVAGTAAGYGMDLANMCDVTVASQNAKFGSTQVKYAMNGFYGGLQRKVGPMRARRMFFTGDLVDATEAHRIGLADEVVPVGELRDRALAIAKRIAQMGPELATVLKEVALRATNMDHIGGIAYELRVTHDLTQRALFHERTPEGLQRVRSGNSPAIERMLG